MRLDVFLLEWKRTTKYSFPHLSGTNGFFRVGPQLPLGFDTEYGAQSSRGGVDTRRCSHYDVASGIVHVSEGI